jgi:hypothetical protein
MNTITIPAGTTPAWTDGNVLSMPVPPAKHAGQSAAAAPAQDEQAQNMPFSAGMWEDYDIDLKKIREQSYRRRTQEYDKYENDTL